jgi:hypothetical protein
MGNPAQANWDKFNSYIIAKLPQLSTLDGTEITKSMRIVALQQLSNMEIELRQLALVKRRENQLKEIEIASEQKEITRSKTSDKDECVEVQDVGEDSEKENDQEDEMTENTPETRVKVWRSRSMTYQ